LLSVLVWCAGLLPWQRAVADDLSAAVLVGTVTRVKDGDSLMVALAGAPGGPMEVRLYGIDTPERAQAGGEEARRFLQRRVLNRRIEVEPVTQDSYDRMIGIVYRDGASVNAALVEAGHAWAYRRYLAEVPGADEFCRLENGARQARRGLWAQPPSTWVPPWTFRQLQRSAAGELRARDYSRETEADCLAAIPRPRGRARPGSPALPPAQVAQPRNCDIKGNINGRGQRIYHVPGGRYYGETQIDTRAGERWFCSEQEARAAGWRRSRQ
jgi:endonuclease YncB( thermonuclease family)